MSTKASQLQPAECFLLGVHLREELKARGWNANDLCRETLIPPTRLHDILQGIGRRLSLREAEALSYGLGVTSAVFLNLDLSYHKFRASQEGQS